MKRSVIAAIAAMVCSLAIPAQAQGYAPGTRIDAYLGGLNWKSCTVVRHRMRQGDYEVRCDGETDLRQVGDDADHVRLATEGARGQVAPVSPAPGTAVAAPAGRAGARQATEGEPAHRDDAGRTNAAEAREYAPGERVDAYLGGRDWQSCVAVRHLVKQGAYEVRCNGKPDTAQVGEDPDHIRPGTQATRASTTRTVAEQAALRRPGPDIDANLRPTTLRPGGKPLSGIYLQLKPMMANAAIGRTSFDYFTFWADGRLCQTLPLGGADPADFDAMRRAKPRLCGRYVFTSGKLTIDVPDNVKIFDYEISNFDGTHFVMNGSTTVKVTGYGKGAVLDGRYAGTRLFPTTVEVSLSLSSNGQFDLVETPRQGGPARHLQGRYRLYGNTLDLGGERHTIYPLEGGRPGRLVLDGYDLDRN